MKRLNERTVELTEEEVAMKTIFDGYLDRGHGIPVAAKLALDEGVRAFTLAHVSKEFASYLSDDTVRLWGGRFIIRPEWREAAS